MWKIGAWRKRVKWDMFKKNHISRNSNLKGLGFIAKKAFIVITVSNKNTFGRLSRKFCSFISWKDAQDIGNQKHLSENKGEEYQIDSQREIFDSVA